MPMFSRSLKNWIARIRAFAGDRRGAAVVLLAFVYRLRWILPGSPGASVFLADP